MLKSIIVQRDAVEALANDRIMRNYPDFRRPMLFQHWSEALDVLSNLINVLQPSLDVTLAVSSANADLSSYVPLVKGMLRQLEALETDGDRVRGVGSILRDLHDGMKKRMKWILDPESCPDIVADPNIVYRTFHASTFMNPRYKAKFAPRRDGAKEAIKTQLLEIAGDLITVPSPMDSNDNHNEHEDDEPNVPMREHPGAAPAQAPPPPLSLSSAIARAMVSSSSDDSDDQMAAVPRRPAYVVAFENELDLYLSQPRIQPTDDPLEYWSHHRGTFPHLAPVAAAMLASPPSSVTSERMFSVAGDVLTKKRCALKPKNLEMLTMIKVNKLYLAD
ncbi:zinc finger BED domain-containing protein 4-like [Lytechinus pictus]|uniref:zinc finger BED domain-containing protein 4-like n=1 Tax=Lytechinus pictus TaxID=7653 RepID=UPI0030B9C114